MTDDQNSPVVIRHMPGDRPEDHAFEVAEPQPHLMSDNIDIS
jgi:hypothetical protein